MYAPSLPTTSTIPSAASAGRGRVRGARGQTPAQGDLSPSPTLQLCNTLLAGVIERLGVAEGMSLHILTVWLVASPTLQLEGEYG